MSTQEPNRNAPFALPLQPAIDLSTSMEATNLIAENGHDRDIVLIVNARSGDPQAKPKRDYVIAAVNSFPLLEEMREALRDMADFGKREGWTHVFIQRADALLAQADAI